ncbi:MAG: META domain-containing protein [Aureispira sp.]|nr:META domain-containing protein [Aureispira sp.]
MYSLKIAILVLFSISIFHHSHAQKSEQEILELNKVNKDKSKFTMMSNSLTETGSIADQLWLVASQKGEKNGQPCLLVKSPRSTTWTELEAKIEDFRYTEGFEYKIMVKHEQFSDKSKADEYRLAGVLEKKKKKSDIRKATEQGTFDNTTWSFTHFEGKKIKEGYIKFSKHGISASVGCNSMSGMSFKANQKKGTLQFTNTDNGIMTCMACSDRAMMKREDRLFPLLKEVTNYEATADKLILKNGNKILMQLKR